ncbi:FxsA family protein [Vogesella indigofera]|uniref:FxsA family protein n=1 Tax=Vogesella indigofera TaxID=45465 RepID=UPI00234EBBB1|nr:FxsA family protein [Vogesella indigofera]MDC7709683.1 FxsA family protein [Vogesella indigofera]
MRAFLIVLLLYPFAEIFSLVTLADAIGGGWTIAWLLLTVLLGVAMMRNSKLASLLTIGSVLKQGQVSLLALLWPLRVMLAGLLFAIPGLISDVLALLLMLPWRGPTLANMAPPSPPPPADGSAGGDIIEGEYQRVDKTVDPNSRLH